jgi:phage shock protein PspC (stress-responsive transcriptional regulator)
MTEETTRNPESTGAEQPAGTEASGIREQSTQGDLSGEQGRTATPAAAPTRPPLRRSATDRKVAGVCGGLGRHLDVDPVIFRVLFGVFVLFGGASLLLYGLAWLLVPGEDHKESDGQRLLAGRGDAHGFLGLVVVLIGFAVFFAFFGSGWNEAFALMVLAGVIFAVVWANNRRPQAPGLRPPVGWAAAGGPPPAPAPPGEPRVAPWWQQPSAAGAGADQGPPAGATTMTMPGTTADPFAADPFAAAPAPAGAPPGPPPMPGPYPYTPPAPPTPPARKHPRSALPWIVLSIALIVVGVLVALGMSGVDNITAQVVLSTVLIVFGVGLVVGTWFGRARSLIALGTVVMVALVTVSTYSVPLRGGAGNREWTPTTAAAVQAQTPYRLGAGEALLDLTSVDPGGGTVKVVASVVFGQLTVRVPDNVRLVVDAHAGMGAVRLPNGRSDGVPADRAYTVDAAVPDSRGTMELTLEVGMGEVEVDRVAA